MISIIIKLNKGGKKIYIYVINQVLVIDKMSFAFISPKSNYYKSLNKIALLFVIANYPTSVCGLITWYIECGHKIVVFIVKKSHVTNLKRKQNY